MAELPKTRSGKIMRRLLRDVAENRELGDVTTLTDSSVMDLIQSQAARPRPARTDRDGAGASRRLDGTPGPCRVPLGVPRSALDAAPRVTG